MSNKTNNEKPAVEILANPIIEDFEASIIEEDDQKLLAKALILAQKLLDNKEQLLTVKEKQLSELIHKANYTENILQSKGTFTVTSIAKDYGMSARKFNILLKDLKIQYNQNGIWFLYKKYQDKSYTHSRTLNFQDSKGVQQVRILTEWTQKGRLFLYDILKKNDIVPMIELF